MLDMDDGAVRNKFFVRAIASVKMGRSSCRNIVA
jgi:hypothetical protein